MGGICLGIMSWALCSKGGYQNANNANNDNFGLYIWTNLRLVWWHRYKQDSDIECEWSRKYGKLFLSLGYDLGCDVEPDEPLSVLEQYINIIIQHE